MRTKRGLLGYYNYTVILTYIGMLVAFVGIALALDGNFKKAVICLMAVSYTHLPSDYNATKQS